MSRHRPSSIEQVNATPMDDLRFRDFVGLRSGRDRFTSLTLDVLVEHVDPGVLDAVRARFEDSKQVASCLRWVCRGLAPDRAIRKVAVDAEVTSCAVAVALERRRRDE